jgi:hypothetical protein
MTVDRIIFVSDKVALNESSCEQFGKISRIRVCQAHKLAVSFSVNTASLAPGIVMAINRTGLVHLASLEIADRE